MRYALTFHFETFYDPVAGGYGVHQSIRHVVLTNVLDYVKLGGSLFGNGLFGYLLQLNNWVFSY